MNKVLITKPYLTLAQAEYGCGAYGAGSYGEECVEEGGLAGTGFDILIPLALGASILIASGVLLFKRLRRRKKTA